jgi:ABC-type nitrate/sulfonate/bicarbonate transport system substrate-binding protein
MFVKQRLNRLVAVLAAVCAATALAACGSSAGDSSGGGGASSGAKDVTIGLTPYFDYMLWPVAQKLGLDKEQGINLKFTWLAQVGPSIQALKRGSIDVVDTCTACNFPYYKTVPSLRDFLVTDQFKGFILIGRKGQAPSYQALIDAGKTPDEARQQVFQYVKGKTFTVHKPVYEGLINGMLDNAGLKPSDVKILDFADDSKAATAFLGGTGDFYMGSLPQETSLLLHHSDKVVNMGGTEILGPAGLWYSTNATDADTVSKDPATLKKLIAIWYRAAAYLKQNPDKALPIIRETINAHAGASFSEAETKINFDQFLTFPTFDEAAKTVFDPSSELYWKRSLDYYEQQNKKSGDLDASTDTSQFNVEEQLFHKVASDPKLKAWIHKPFGSGS